jgi:hypothetical protein
MRSKSYRVLAEDAATNNIGSVTVLHSRERVQAVPQEAQPVLRMFQHVVQPNAFAAHLPAVGVSGASAVETTPSVQADSLPADHGKATRQ